MRRSLYSASIAIASAAIFCGAACVGTTGGAIVDFPAAAAGPTDIRFPATFTTDRGYAVTLTTATLHVGAVYLDQSEPVSGAQNTACILPGTYVAQETSPLDVNLLSATPQRFADLAHGTSVPALVAQVWLTSGDIDDIDDAAPILTVAGTAERNGATIPFSGSITIGANRLPQSTPSSGASPICKQRIVSPIPANVTVQDHGGLVLRIDPRALFVNVDFVQLPKASGGRFAFSDDPTSSDYGQPSVNLYENLRASGTLWSVSWSDDL